MTFFANSSTPSPKSSSPFAKNFLSIFSTTFEDPLVTNASLSRASIVRRSLPKNFSSSSNKSSNSRKSVLPPVFTATKNKVEPTNIAAESRPSSTGFQLVSQDITPHDTNAATPPGPAEKRTIPRASIHHLNFHRFSYENKIWRPIKCSPSPSTIKVFAPLSRPGGSVIPPYDFVVKYPIPVTLGPTESTDIGGWSIRVRLYCVPLSSSYTMRNFSCVVSKFTSQYRTIRPSEQMNGCVSSLICCDLPVDSVNSLPFSNTMEP